MLGVEADLDFANITGDDAGNGDATETITIGTQASLRGRLGYDAGGLLFYATAGLAVADVTATSVLDFAPFTSNEESQLYVGWTAGLGLEARVSDAWSIAQSTATRTLAAAISSGPTSRTPPTTSPATPFAPARVITSDRRRAARAGMNCRRSPLKSRRSRSEALVAFRQKCTNEARVG